VLAPRLAPEVAHVEVGVVRPVQVQQPLDLGHGRAPRGRRMAAMIKQPVVAELLVAGAQPPDAAGTAAENVGGLKPGEFATQRLQDDLLNLHGALHGADGIAHGHLLGD
jgi:hypothetical protein